MTKRGIALAALLSAGYASAQTSWVRSASAGGVWYVSAADSANEADQSPTVWIKVDGSHDKAVKWRTWMMRIKFDCAAQTYTSLADIIYDANGNTTYSRTFSAYEQETKPMPPDTAMIATARKVCPSRSIP